MTEIRKLGRIARTNEKLYGVGEIAEQCEVYRQTLNRWLLRNEHTQPKYIIVLGEKEIPLWTHDQMLKVRTEYGR